MPDLACVIAPCEKPAEAGDLVGAMLPWAIAGVAAIAAIVFLVLWLGARRRGRTTPMTQPPAPAAPPPPQPQPLSQPGSQPIPSATIDELIALADLADNPVVIAQTRKVLRSVGVEPLPAEPGMAFDPRVHAAHQTQPTADPALAGRIHTVLRAGWVRGAAILRPADVTVWAVTQ